MSLGIVGIKCGMTRVFTPEGHSIPVTVVHTGKNYITQIKKIEPDGYNSIQVSCLALKKKLKTVSKPILGHYAKAHVSPGLGLWEFRFPNPFDFSGFHLGMEVDISMFSSNQKVDVRGFSKGKGFQGVVKRHNFKTQDASHGNSLSHRVHGSTGQNQDPGRVFKNKKMAGHMGNDRVTIQMLTIIKVDITNDLLLLRGGIPGFNGSNIVITPSVKFMDSNIIMGEKL